MATIFQEWKYQMVQATERYNCEDAKQIRNLISTSPKEWLQFEKPSRVFARIKSLKLDALGAEALANKPDQTYKSKLHVNKQLSLLERIIEENNLISSNFLHKGSQVASCVGRIVIRRGGKTLGYGTGFMISPRLLMTNHHVLPTADNARESLIEFNYFERENGQTGPVETFSLKPDSFFLSDSSLDFAIVAINERSFTGKPLDCGWLSLIKESGKALVGEPVYIIQHPRGKPQHVVLKDNQVTQLFTNYFYYLTDTEQGSSGSPVCNMQWQLVGLHHAGVAKKDNSGRVLLRNGAPWDESEDKVQDLAWVANEGVSASAIVSFIERTLHSDDARSWINQAYLPYIPSEKQRLNEANYSHSKPKDEEKIVITESERLDLDRLTPNEIQELLATHDNSTMVFEEAERQEVFVAEGDSWFDYAPAGLDIITCLKLYFNRKIVCVADAGDTLEDMTWGTKYKRNWTRNSPQIERTVEAVSQYKPKTVLLSGGGNDIAGTELLAFLNHSGTGLKPLRGHYVDDLMNNYFPMAYKKIMERIWAIRPDTRIIVHGYGYPIPDGRPVINLFGFHFFGPWLKPSLTAKGYEDLKSGKRIMKELIDRFNVMLSAMAAKDQRIIYLDLRTHISDNDWVNELHLKNSAYHRVAALYDKML